MSLVQLHKARKAHRRSKRLKGKPEWQDVVPRTRQGRDAYKIADKYQSRFSRNYLAAIRGLLEGKDIERAFKEAWKTGSVMDIMNALPLYQEGLSEENPTWAIFQEQMAASYQDVIQAAGEDAMRDLNRAIGSNLRFVVENEETSGPEELTKAKRKAVPVVPVNPYSKAWIKEHVMELVREGIGPQQRKLIEQILIDNFSKGIRAEEALKLIRESIGLTSREYKAVENFERRVVQEILKKGKPLGQALELARDKAVKYTEKLTRKRAIRIARTETIRANAQGRSDAWRVAIEEGSLSGQVVREWLTPPPSPNPGRPCKICLDLDGKTAPVGGTYESAFVGAVAGPPVHPQCRCTETLIRADEED